MPKPQELRKVKRPLKKYGIIYVSGKGRLPKFHDPETNALTHRSQMYIFKVYTLTGEGNLMKTAKIFKSGNSQAVRLPKELQFDVSEVEIFRRGDEIVLRKKPQNLTRVFELLADMSEDFMANGRRQPSMQEREPF